MKPCRRVKTVTIAERIMARNEALIVQSHTARELARNRLAEAAPQAAEVLIKAAAGGDVRAADSVLDRAIGKPVQSIAAAVITDQRSLREIPTAELLALIAQASQAGQHDPDTTTVIDVPAR